MSAPQNADATMGIVRFIITTHLACEVLDERRGCHFRVKLYNSAHKLIYAERIRIYDTVVMNMQTFRPTVTFPF